MQRWRRLVLRPVAALAGVSLLVAAGGSTAVAQTTALRSQAREPLICARVAQRLEEVPGINRRIRTEVAALEARIAAAAEPRRRARLEARLRPRIENLQRLARRIAEDVARAEAKCPRGGVATTAPVT